MEKKQMTKELRQIAKIFNKIFGKDMYELDIRNKVIFSPIGSIIFSGESNAWGFGINYNWVFETQNENVQVDQLYYAMLLVMDIKKEFPDLVLFDGHYEVWDDEYEMYAGTLSLSEIEKYAKENEIDWEIAKNVLTQKEIVQRREKIEEYIKNQEE